ncbi:hypothetical protein MAINES_00280 [Brevundimonas phage vB_BpoS-MaInes]|nr:hypothetical protein MAINES_00280 [Brevundimonas phage vB_BpoS-MaInes]
MFEFGSDPKKVKALRAQLEEVLAKPIEVDYEAARKVIREGAAKVAEQTPNMSGEFITMTERDMYKSNIRSMEVALNIIKVIEDMGAEEPVTTNELSVGTTQAILALCVADKQDIIAHGCAHVYQSVAPTLKSMAFVSILTHTLKPKA